MTNFSRKISAITLKPIYPFLFALFPVFSLYSNNITELRFEDILTALFGVLALSFVIFLLAEQYFKNQTKAAFLVCVILVLVFSYGHVHNLIPNFQVNFQGVSFGRDKLLLPLWGLLFMLGIFLTIKKDFKKITQPLNIFSFILLILPLVTIFSYEISSGRYFGQGNKPTAIAANNVLERPDNPPDVYYFIFDRYASFQNLKEFYNFENKNLYNFLDDRNFYIAKNSRDNYPATFLSLASSLNLDYLDKVHPNLPINSNDKTIVYQHVSNYKAEKYFREIGYKFINVGSWWGPTRANKNADKNYVFTLSKFLNLDEFSTKLLASTILAPIIEKTSHLNLDESFNNFDHRNRILYGFESLKKIPTEISGPKFVFGHILVPHAPYVLDQNCKPIKEADTKKHNQTENYLNQMKCGNKNIKEVVEKILQGPNGKNSIIVLQADEGPAPIINKFGPKWNTSSVKAMREKTGILNAYYFPKGDYQNLSQTITPVNTFRIIFNRYFGANFPILKDKVYIFESSDRPYKFFDITSKLGGK